MSIPTLHKACKFVADHKHFLRMTVLFVIVCALCAMEAAFVHAYSFSASWNDKGVRLLFFLGFFWAAIFLCLLGRFSVFMIVGQALVSLFILTYIANLHSLPTASAMVNSWRYAAEMKSDVFSHVNPTAAVMLTIMALVKIGLLCRLSQFGRKLRVLGICLAVLSIAAIYIHQYRHNAWPDMLDTNFPNFSNPTLTHIKKRGYVLTWALELACNIPARELERFQEQPSSASRVAQLPLAPVGGQITIIQVESLDWRALNLEENGQLVAPFLQQLSKSALVFRCSGSKVIASANAEYEMLNARIAHMQVLYFAKVHTYPDSILALMRKAGWHTAFIHGVQGNYMNRRDTYPRLGAEQAYFREELEKAGFPGRSDLFLRHIPDADLLRFAATQIYGKSKIFQFIVTTTMHGACPPMSDFNGNSLYSNLLHYFDNGLKQYVDSLEDGAMVIIYGDHSAYDNAYYSGEVPFMVYVKGRNISFPGLNSEIYSRSEMSHYLRRLFHLPPAGQQ
jgi:hypothetical protein